MSKKLINVLVSTTILSTLTCSQASAKNQHLLAFQGGGFRAMVAQAGLLAGALEYQKTQQRLPNPKLAPLLANIDLVSGNSGGTWFASDLAYSKDFVASLEDYNNFFIKNNNDKSKSGYMWQVGDAWANFLNPARMQQRLQPNERIDLNQVVQLIKAILKIAEATIDGIGLAQNLTVALSAPVLNWDNILTNTVFKPYNIAAALKRTNFLNNTDQNSNQRTDALKDRPLIYELAVSTDQAALGPFNQPTSTSLFKNVTTATATNIGKDYENKPYKYIPASATSKGKITDIAAPTLPSVSNGRMEITYANAPDILWKAQPTTASLPNVNLDGLSVFAATTASSAAAAIVDSAGSLYSNKTISSPFVPTYAVNGAINLLKELATPVKIKTKNNTSTTLAYADVKSGKDYPQIGSVTPKTLSEQPLLRFADGGYVDNTSVTSGMSYLNKNLKEGFKVTLFATYMASSAKDDPSDLVVKVDKNYQNLDDTTRALFTKSGQFQSRSGFNASHPTAEVFDSSKTTGLNTPAWQYQSTDKKFTIKYYKLGVTTSKNNYSIKTGVKGSLDVWEIYTPADTAPPPIASGWTQYSVLYNNIRTGLNKDGGIGAQLLINSLKNNP